MEHASFGHELIIAVVALLLFFHLTLDVLPLLYKRLRAGFAAAPVRTGTGFLLILTACFLM